MNETTPTQKSEFVFRRVFDSFDQFAGDLGTALAGGTIAKLLLAFMVLALAARIVYRYSNPASRAPGAKDPTAYWLRVATWVSVGAFVIWGLVAFYNRDSDPSKGTGETVSTLGAGNAAKWYVFTAALFALGAVFVVFMYIKDTKTVRWYWAVPLALLRITVYAILCTVFLLPSLQTWEDTNKQSRVVILLDISPSVTNVTDEIGSGPGRRPKTRMDILVEFLTDERIAFLKNLLDKNPVAIYAFGTRLDESPTLVEQGAQPWTKADWDSFARYDLKPHVLRGLSEDGQAQLKKTTDWNGDKKGDAAWGRSWAAKRNDPELQKTLGLSSAEDAEQLKKNLERLDKRVDVAETITKGTNVVDSVKAALDREAANMVQGIIVFSDGRSNLGGEAGYLELRERATREKIPVFTVAVGEDRQTSAMTITEVNAPDSAPIDEAWKVIVEADGVNMANKEVEVFLDLWLPGRDMKVAPADHTLTEKLVFAPGDPPHGQAEFVIDPAKLPEKLTTESTDAAIKKRVLKEGKWSVRARIAKDPQEAFTEAEHVRDRPDINVVQKKIRILLFGSALPREAAFLRILLAREVQDKRASLATYIQNEAGTTGKITPEQDEVMLSRFPDRFDLTGKKTAPEDKPYNLNEYDVIVAFDPDWSELSQQQADDLARWVREGGGGLIYGAGPINTFQLARVERPTGKLVPLLNVLPVEPADIVVRNIRPIPKTPRRLYFYPERIPGSDLLKLDDKVMDDPTAGWERFFTDREKFVPNADWKKDLEPERGFFSCYPIQEVKAGSAVLADFADVSDTGEALKMPFIVTNNPSAQYRTIFLASPEFHKMKVYEPDVGTGREYFERFWVKLIKYASAKRNLKAPRGRVLVSKEAVSGTPLRVQARILNETARPYAPGAIGPKFRIVQEAPNGEKREPGNGPWVMTEKISAAGAFDGYYAGQVNLDLKDFPTENFIYRVVIDVPDAPGETLSAEFRIRKSDPEMDNTRPDYQAMLRMASAFDDDFRGRITSDKVRSELVTRLPKEGITPRLAFKITDKELIGLIPECMKTDRKQMRNLGPINDLWDRGFNMPTSEIEEPTYARKYFISWWSGQRVSLVLLVVVGLLALEWLVRKLLRLA
jgi:hypothetical protein